MGTKNKHVLSFSEHLARSQLLDAEHFGKRIPSFRCSALENIDLNNSNVICFSNNQLLFYPAKIAKFSLLILEGGKQFFYSWSYLIIRKNSLKRLSSVWWRQILSSWTTVASLPHLQAVPDAATMPYGKANIPDCSDTKYLLLTSLEESSCTNAFVQRFQSLGALQGFLSSGDLLLRSNLVVYGEPCWKYTGVQG